MTFAGYFKHIFIAICEYIKTTNFACADLVEYDRNYHKENVELFFNFAHGENTVNGLLLV